MIDDIEKIGASVRESIYNQNDQILVIWILFSYVIP